MANLTMKKIVDDTTAGNTRAKSFSTFIQGLHQLVNQAIAGQVNPSTQVNVDAVFADAEANVGVIDGALSTNATPPGEPAGPRLVSGQSQSQKSKYPRGTVLYQDKPVDVLRDAGPGDPGYDMSRGEQLYIRLEDGSTKVVLRSETRLV